MKLSQPLFWLLTVLWFAAGAWWYSGSLCSTCATTVSATDNKGPTPVATSASAPPFKASDSVWMLYNADNLRFGKSASDPVLSNMVSKTIDSLADHSKNSMRQVVVTGYYASSEKNTPALKIWVWQEQMHLKKF